MRLKDILKESTEASEIIKDLDKVRTDLIKKVDVLIAKKKKLYSDVDITTPMSADEKKLDKDIQDIFSQIQQIIQQKRKIKNESINELTYNEKQIKDGNPNNVFYVFYKGQFEAIYSAMGPRGLFDMYWDKFKVRRPAGSKFKLNPEFVIVPKKEYDNSTSNHYAKLKPHVDKLWDTLKNESVNEGKYYIGYNKGRGQGTGVFKDVFPTYKDAKKEVEKIEKQRGGSYNQIAYYVADEKGNFVREAMLGEGRGIKSIQSDLDKTVIAIESEIASYKATKGTPQEKKHIDNLKKLHPIKKKLQSELDMAVSGLYRDAELKIED
jgi:hypothetical protein